MDFLKTETKLNKNVNLYYKIQSIVFESIFFVSIQRGGAGSSCVRSTSAHESLQHTGIVFRVADPGIRV